MGKIQLLNNANKELVIHNKLPKVLSLRKTSDTSPYGTDTNFGSGSITQFSPEIRNPLLNPENFFLPKFQSNDGTPNIELNLWFDSYSRWHPLVGNIIGLHCATKGTPVMTKKGVKNVEDVTTEDKVISSDGKYQKILATEPTLYDGKFVTVRGNGILGTQWTANHPFKIRKSIREKVQSGKYTWYRNTFSTATMWQTADKLELGDYLVYPKFKEEQYNNELYLDITKYISEYGGNHGKVKLFDITEDSITNRCGSVINTISRFVKIDENFAELMGWWLAEGHISKSVIGFSLNFNEEKEGDRIAELLNIVFGIGENNISIYLKEYKSVREVVCSSSAIAQFIENLFSKGANNKRIPDEIMLNNKDVIKSLLRSLIDGDGCVRKRDVLYVTVSKTMAYQMQLLGTKIGLFFKMRIADRTNCKMKGNYDQYILTCSKEEYYDVLYDGITDYKKSTKQIRTIKEDDNYYYLPITELSYCEKEEEVYDIMTEDESFLSTCIVHNSTLPISRFGLVGVTDKEVLNVYEEMSENMDLFQNCQDILYQWFKRGEVQPFGWWDDDLGYFTSMSMIDTNYIYVTGHPMIRNNNGEVPEIYEYYPDEYLIQLLKTNNPMEQELLDYIDTDLQEAVENNLSVILDPFSTNMIRRKLNSWDLRGTGIISNVLKILLLEDKLRESQYSSAQSNINPYRLWTLGNDENMADSEQLEDLRTLVQQAQYDSQMNIFSHHLLKLEIQGAVGKADKMFQDFQYIEQQILTGLWSNKALTVSEGVSYNSSSVAMRVLMGRYIPIRNMLENYIYKKVFLPVAIRHDFYKITEAELAHGIRKAKKDRTPLYPRFDWRHKQSLLDDQSIRSMLIQLQGASKMPMKVICDSLDIEYDYVKNWLEKEMNTVFDNDFIAGRKTLINSAVAGGLKDKGKSMVKRMVEAGVEWAKGVMGYSPNLDIEGGEQDVETSNEQETDNLMGDDELAKDKKKLDKKTIKQIEDYKTQYEKDQIKQIKTINRKYHDEVENQLKKRSGNFNKGTTTRSIVVKELHANGMDVGIQKVVRDYLYDFKLLFSKQGIRYVNGDDSVMSNIAQVNDMMNEQYNKALYDVMKISQSKMEGIVGKSLPENVFIRTSEFKLNTEFDNIKKLDTDVAKAYWESITSNLERQVVNNFVKASKLSEIETIKKLGYENMIIDDEIFPTTAKIEKFSISNKILPYTDGKEKLNIKVGKMAINEMPIEKYWKVKAVAETYNSASEIKYSDFIMDSIGDKYFGNLYYHISTAMMDRVTDLYEKYYEGADEEQWFRINGCRFIKGELMNEEVEVFFKDIVKQ